MGNQVSTKIRPEILKLEINYIKSQQLCSSGLKTEIDKDIEIMLRSVKQPIDGQSIEGGHLQPEIKEILLDRINAYRLNDEVEQRFFDPQLMSMITCLYGNLLSIDKDLFKITPAAKEYFRLTDNLSIGNWGIVFKARHSGAELNFIVKTQVNPRLSDLSIHEVFAAVKALNPLRRFCPNFSILYGGFICGKPDGITGKLCGADQAPGINRDEVPYTIYENIPGNTLSGMIMNLPNQPFNLNNSPLDQNYAEILSSLLQVFFALKTAHLQAFEFSHRDLHVENVILRPLASERLIRYRSQLMKPIRGINGQKDDKANFDYYVRSRYVTTIIDYDNCELYLPVSYGENDIRTERFGGPDLDPLGSKPISGDPHLSHIRDLAKLLGFTAYTTLKSKAHDTFKYLMMDIYLQTIIPEVPDKYRVNNPDASVLNVKLTPADYTEILTRERESYFQVTQRQVRLSREGRLHFDDFFEVFTRLVPQKYLNYILLIDNHPARLDDKVADAAQIRNVEKSTNVQVLGCTDNTCSSDVETYRRIINPQDEAKLAVKNPLKPEDLSYQILDAKRETLRLDNNFRSDFKAVRIAPQVSNPQVTVQYREVLVAKLLLAEAELTNSRAASLGYKIQNLLGQTKLLLQGFILPKHQDFQRLYPKPYVGILAYRQVIDRAFKLIAMVTEVRAIHESLIPTQAQTAALYNTEVIMAINAVNSFISGPFTIWRDELLQLVNAKFFGPSTPEISRIILSKIL